jgi:thymidylate kinase
MDFQNRIRQGYLDLAGSLPRFRVVDANLPPEKISDIIIETVARFLKGDCQVAD